MSATPHSSSFIRYASQGAIATLTFDRPDERNAIADHEACEAIVEAVQRVEADAAIHCVILTGAGSAFSAGGNLKAMRERKGIGRLDSPIATRANYRRGVQRAIRALWELDTPMIAAINGHAIGLGLDLACACDIRITADTAKMASSFINVGLIPGDGGAWILPRIVGLSKASEMILTGDTLDAQQALACGLVSQVVPANALMTTAHEMAERIASRPAQALRLSKRLLREAQHSRLSDVLELSAAFQALAHETDDHSEALDAFVQKRPPRFKGR